MYGSGMPILYLSTAASLFLIYWVDKITLFRLYSSPPRYNKKLMSSVRSWLTIGLVIHMIMGFWMYSNSTIFDTTD